MLGNRISAGFALRKLRITFGACCLLIAAAGPAGAEFRPLDRLEDTTIEPIERFVAAEAFKVGRRIGGRTLSAIGLNFTQYFLAVVEKDVPAASLGRWTLQYAVSDKFLIKAVGGEREAVLPFLAHVYQVMEAGDDGGVYTDWRSNFAYLRSPIDHRLWAVHWTVNYANEWTVGAVYVPHPDLDWRSGSRLFTNGCSTQGRRARASHARGTLTYTHQFGSRLAPQPILESMPCEPVQLHPIRPSRP